MSLRPDHLRLLQELPTLAGREFEVEVLAGGLTNTNLRVRTSEGDLVVRISPETAGLLTIDRDAEYRNSQRAAAVGIAPAVVDYLPGRGVLAVAYIPSRTFTEQDVARHLPRVAEGVRTLHTAQAFANDFDIFATQDRYLAIVRGRGWDLPEGYAELAPLAARLRAALRSRPEVRVPCHNDLLAANLLDQGSRVWIIDYEYSGNNEPAFELGNLAQENHLSNADLIALTELYYGRRDDRLIARTRLWQMASALVWTVWGVISAQANDLDIDVDFQAWAQEKFGRARSALTAPGFADLLAAGAGS